MSKTNPKSGHELILTQADINDKIATSHLLGGELYLKILKMIQDFNEIKAKLLTHDKEVEFFEASYKPAKDTKDVAEVNMLVCFKNCNCLKIRVGSYCQGGSNCILFTRDNKDSCSRIINELLPFIDRTVNNTLNEYDRRFLFI